MPVNFDGRLLKLIDDSDGSDGPIIAKVVPIKRLPIRHFVR